MKILALIAVFLLLSTTTAVESYKLGSYTPSTCSGYIVKPYDSVSNTAGICACDPKISNVLVNLLRCAQHYLSD